MDWITMSCLISYLRWGSKLGSNSEIDFCLLWAKLWHAAGVKQLSPVEVGCLRTWNRDGVELIPLESTGKLLVGAGQWVRADVLVCASSCAAQAQLPGWTCSAEQMWHFAWAFSSEELLLCEMQQRLSGQEFQLNTASIPVVWCGSVLCPWHELFQ